MKKYEEAKKDLVLNVLKFFQELENWRKDLKFSNS